VSDAAIIDAHVHVGQPGLFFAPETEPRELVATMDRLGIAYAVGTDHKSLYEPGGERLARLRDVFEQSEGRLHYLGVFDPRRSAECTSALEHARDWPGFVGLKIHPSLHRVPADDTAYEQAWRYAAEHDLPILTHSWSVSDYNAVQYLSTPERFEGWVRRFPGVRLVLGHAGGRGAGRSDAVRMANEYANVFLDFAGDIFCYRLIETLVESVPVDKILFGSDHPWSDPRAHLSQVLLAEIGVSAKTKILGRNAMRVYRIGTGRC